MSSYRGLYPGASAEAPKGYRQWLAKRTRPLIRMHGLDGRHEDDYSRRGFRPGQGHVQTTVSTAATVRFTPSARSEASPAQPMLF